MSKHDDSTSALARLLDSDHLARVVPELAPEALHRLILHRGLEACGDLVAAATSEQIVSLFDLDLWQAARPGFDEQLDVSRFGEWVEMLVDKDPSLAARTVAALDARLAIAAMSRYIRIFDPAVFERIVPTEEVDPDAPPVAGWFSGLSCELGGYVVRARRTENWDAIVELLHALEADQPGRFDEVMRGCRRLSNDRAEEDGFHDLLDTPEQLLFDATLDRENRREAQGYVTPADARAFLEKARRPRQANEPGQANEARESRPQPRKQGPHQGSASERPTIVGQDGSRALIEREGGDDASQTRLWQAMRHVNEHDADLFDERMRELAFLAGALVAGCSLGDRPFTPREAHDAAIAICNIGIERWLGSGVDAPMPDDFLVSHALVETFEAGWAVLHEEVSLFAADRLIATLRDLKFEDLDIRRGLVVLERELMKHRAAGAPWRVREKLDVIAILDMAGWTSLLGLFSECPVMPAALTAILTGDINPIDAHAFAFISTSDQLADIRAFMTRLPDVLLR